jgi:predicted transcriptional regulator
MQKNQEHHLSRRERQIMDIIHRRGKATVAEVSESLPDPPSYSAVRAMMRILEEKGHLKHRQEGARYVYMATQSREKASRSALKRVIATFFDGSIEQAVSALIDSSDAKLSGTELDKIQQIIDQAKKEGK